MDPFIAFIGVGLLAGLICGYLGVGAAIVVIPLLTLGLGYEQKVAQGISLTVIVPMALAGALMYRFQLRIAPPVGPVLAMAASAVAGSIAGSLLAGATRPRHLKLAFALFVIGVGVVLLVRSARAIWHA